MVLAPPTCSEGPGLLLALLFALLLGETNRRWSDSCIPSLFRSQPPLPRTRWSSLTHPVLPARPSAFQRGSILNPFQDLLLATHFTSVVALNPQPPNFCLTTQPRKYSPVLLCMQNHRKTPRTLQALMAVKTIQKYVAGACYVEPHGVRGTPHIHYIHMRGAGYSALTHPFQHSILTCSLLLYRGNPGSKYAAGPGGWCRGKGHQQDLYQD